MSRRQKSLKRMDSILCKNTISCTTWVRRLPILEAAPTLKLPQFVGERCSTLSDVAKDGKRY